MTIKKMFVITLIFISLMFLVKPWKWHVHIQNNHKTLSQMLELSPSQTFFEKKLYEDNKKEVKPILLELEKTTKNYKELVNNKVDVDIVLNEKKKIDILYKKYKEIQKKHMQEFEKILTLDQREKFKIIRTQLFQVY